MPGCWTWCTSCSAQSSGRPKISSPVHLLLKPPDAELLGHAFKQKQFRRSRPCNLCHQPVKNFGISCRVCKYTCHRTCEPKNLGRSFQDPAKIIFQHQQDQRLRQSAQQLPGGPVTPPADHLNSRNASEPLLSRQASSCKQTISPSRGRMSASPVRRMDSASSSASPGAVMDLSFVTERILALSFPPDIDPLDYRQGLHQAALMLQTKHGDNYMVFNLSLPRKEIGQWNQRVLDVGWADNLAPPLERLCSVCRALDSWLQADPQHVAVLHSKCGLQRVGVVVAAYCEYTGLCPPHHHDQSLDRFSMKRFLNERVGGLQSPSDKRYVEYFAGLLSGTIQVNSSPLFLDHVTVVGIPAFQSNGGCRAFFKVYQGSVPVHTSSIYNVHDSARHFTVPMGERGLALRGDILVKCYHRHRRSTTAVSAADSSGGGHPSTSSSGDGCSASGREAVFSLQFHTCAVTQHTLIFQRQDLDDACRDLRFPLDGSVRLHFSSGPESSSARLMGVNDTHTRYTVEPSTGDPIVRWDSYDTVTDSSVSNADDVSHRLVHTYGPLDGSLYAKVLKNHSKTPPSSPSVSGAGHHEVRFGPDFHHHHREPFLNSPHVASTDSGISSAGLVRSGSNHPGGGSGGSGSGHGGHNSSGSTSASPPHSGHSAAFTDPPSTPSPIQQAHQPLKTMPSIVETRAEVHHSTSAAPPPPPPPGGMTSSSTATTELDQLLSGMLMNVQNIPDIRPERRAHFAPDIDVDSIQVNFDLTPSSHHNSSRDTTDSISPPPRSSLKQSKSNPSPGYVYESDTVRRAAHPVSAMKQPQLLSRQGSSVEEKNIPYHAREDSKPFTYGLLTNGASGAAVENGGGGSSTPTSPSVHRRNWKESSPGAQQNGKTGLESPSLVRKFSTGSESAPLLTPRSAPRIPPPVICQPTSPRPIRKLSDSISSPGSTSGGIQPVATSSPRLDTSRQRSVSVTERTTTTTTSTGKSLEEAIQDISTSPDSSRMSTDGAMGLSWLQRQQQKLRERKDSMRRAERHPQESRLLSELRSSQQFKGQQQQNQQQSGGRPGDDGYLSDVTLFSELDIVGTSREGSPDIRSLYATPLHINTSGAGAYGQYQQSKGGKGAAGGSKSGASNSNPGSPMLVQRSFSLERGRYNNLEPVEQHEQAQKMILTRQKSDLSHDRERPFVAVKRAHEQHLKSLNMSHNRGQTPNDLLTLASPYDPEDPSNPAGFLATTLSSGPLSAPADFGLTREPVVVGHVSRLGNLDRLIQTLNVSLPDPATLLRHPQLLRRISSERHYNQQHQGLCDGVNNATATSDQTDSAGPPVSAPPSSSSPLASSPSSSPHNQSVSSSNHSQSDDARNHLTNPVADQSSSTNHKFPLPESAMSWNSSLSGEDLSNRPVTPAFPVVPRTPYLNVHHPHHHHQFGGSGRQSVDSPVTPTSTHSGGGLPPKSPTTQRRNTGGAAAQSGGGGSPYSPTPSSAKILRKWPSNSSVSSKERSPSPSPSSAYLGGGQSSHSRRSSIQSVGALSEPQEVNPVHVNFVKDTSRFWYKPNIAREDAINLLKDQAPGTFIVRDSNSFPGAFGLALKVATPPPHAAAKVTNGGDPSTELVRHFLIEPTSKGVRIKGCSNEPVFGSLSALIYQHSVTPLALPIKLVLPERELIQRDGSSSQALTSPTSQLLTQGAACNLLYLFTMDTESLTGPQAIQRTMTHLLDLRPLPTPTVVHFKVSAQGITLTDNERKLFFRRHYPVSTVSHCGLDPEDRRWNQRSEETGLPISSNRCFGFVARKPASKTDNQCHIFAELEAEQPATAIVNFVTKVMMVVPATNSKSNV